MPRHALANRETELEVLENLAAELARLAGAEVEQSLGRTISVRYKGATGAFRSGDPVSEVDHHVETLIRARIAEAHPDHHIIGEEFGARTNVEHEVVWAIDPIDGTANFVNGVPLFAACVGVLIGGVPAAGAVWCSTSHALRAGVYSAHKGGALRFDGSDMVRITNPNVYQRVIGVPSTTSFEHGAFDTRKTGSAAIECAFVSAGLMAGAYFARPFVWDVAAGLVLVEASGGTIRTRANRGWEDLTTFRTIEGASNVALEHWRQPIAVGEAEALLALEVANP